MDNAASNKHGGKRLEAGRKSSNGATSEEATVVRMPCKPKKHFFLLFQNCMNKKASKNRGFGLRIFKTGCLKDYVFFITK